MIFQLGELFCGPDGLACCAAYANLITVRIVAIFCKCRWTYNGVSDSLMYSITKY